VSLAISDLIKTSASEPAIAVQNGNYQVSSSNSAQNVDPLAKDADECVESFADLMRTFQSKCEYTRTLTYKRFVAAFVVLASLTVCAAGFGLAYYLDRKAAAVSQGPLLN
jgi:hypothetical protein